jgi:hypothetical protein
MKEMCHGWYFRFLYISFQYLSLHGFAGEVQILVGLEQKFVKKLPLFGKIFIHPPSHSGIFDGSGQIA